jgi:hypothetical protein
VSTPPSLGANPNVTARVLDPGLQTTTVQLQPSAPNQFGGSFQEGGQGAYFVTVEAHGAGHGAAGQVGMDVSYSPEFRTTGVNMPFLRQLAAAGGGSVISGPQDAWLNNLPSVLAQYDLTTWLLLLAVFLLPVDVGVRRLVVSRRELVAILNALPFRRPAEPPPEPAVAPLSALRARRARRVAVASGAQRAEGSGMRLPGSAAASIGGPRASARRPLTLEPSVETSELSEGESVASRLLAAKRNKR